jgi:hypothetical protein
MGYFNINADNTPVLDKTGFDSYWSVEDWLFWVKANVAKYGKVKAKTKFEKYWYRQDHTASPKIWGSGNLAFVEYLKSIDIDILETLGSVVYGAKKVVKGVGDFSSGVGERLTKVGEKIGEGMKPSTKILIAVCIVLIFCIAGVIIYGKYFKEKQI